MPTMNLNVKMVKQEIEIDLDKVPDRIYQAALRIGFEQIINRGVTKAKYDTTGLEGQELEAMQAKALEKAEANVQDIYADKTRIVGSRKKSGVPRAVNTEAMRMAKEQLKVMLKKKGVKLSRIKASDLTTAAKAYLEVNPAILAKAYEIVEEREKPEVMEGFDINTLIAAAGEEGEVISRAAVAGRVRSRTR